MIAGTTRFSGGMPLLLASALLPSNLFSLFEFHEKSPHLVLPLAQQLEYLALSTYINWAVGLSVASLLTLPLCRTLTRRYWVGWLTGAAFTFIVGMRAAFPQLSGYWRIVPIALLAFSFLTLVSWIGSKFPIIEKPLVWAVVNLLALLTILSRISLHAPLTHAISVDGLLVFAPVALVSLALPAFLAAKAARRWLVPLSVSPLLLFLALWWIVPSRHVKDGASSPNILLISVDTLRRDHLGAYGNATIRTPNIDSLAERGVVFEQAFSAIPLTNPSHTTMLTGLYPGEHGVRVNGGVPFDQRIPTLPALLSDQGYRTAGFVGGFTLERTISQLANSFEVYDDHLGVFGTLRTLLLKHRVPQLVARCLTQFTGVDYTPPAVDRRAEYVIGAAKEWLEANSARPFFAFVHLFDPHVPYQPPSPYDAIYDGDYKGKVDGSWYGLSDAERDRVVGNPEDLEHIKALYKGEITYVDTQIGVLWRVLDRLKLWDNTLIIFTADHGEHLTEHGYYFDHANSLLDPSVSVPLIMAFPGDAARSGRVDYLTESVDLFPTVLAFLGIEAPKSSGISLLPMLSGEKVAQRSEPVISASFRPEAVPRLALRTAKYKYVLTLPAWHGLALAPGSEALYDLDLDPQELHDIASELPEISDRFRIRARRYVEAWFTDSPGDARAMSGDAGEKLRSLGYL